MAYDAVAIGASAGGLDALKTILSALPASFTLAVAVVQHRDRSSGAYLTEFLGRDAAIPVLEAEDKQAFCPGCAYLAPAGYHLLIEPDFSLSLSVDPPVNYCRPSIDVLFESAALAYARRLIGVVLTGANSDGAQGLKAIKARGGLAMVQDPQSAYCPAMPNAALAAVTADHIVPLAQVAALLTGLSNPQGEPL